MYIDTVNVVFLLLGFAVGFILGMLVRSSINGIQIRPPFNSDSSHSALLNYLENTQQPMYKSNIIYLDDGPELDSVDKEVRKNSSKS